MKPSTQSLLVISSFPARGQVHGRATVGVAPYAKNMLLGIQSYARQHKQRLTVTVLAEHLKGQPKISQDHGMEVRRVWQLNNPISLIALAYHALIDTSPTVLLQFEFAMFGKAYMLPLTLLLMILLKLARKRVILAMHQVPQTIHEIAIHINIPPLSWQSDVATLGLHGYYRALMAFTDRIIVFDEIFRQRLLPYGNHKKIGVIPHGVEPSERVSRTTARKTLGLTNEFVVLCFGYLAWYKGTDWIMEYIAALKKNAFPRPVKLIIAGGPNPQRIDLPYYRRYVETLDAIANRSHGTVTITGYIPEKDMGNYFAAADITLLPYRTLMSASGPMAIAARFGTPIVLSEALERILDAPDAQQVMKIAGIAKKDMVIPFDPKKYTSMLMKYMTQPELLTRMATFSQQIAKLRAFTSIAKNWWNEIVTR
ncbi:MAG: glycosyltransferase [Candidatus Gottesmanbacteria bacterium]|nr:glycosyltransferase [Candidatus Gottesmanbacteria bacterium]